MSKKMGRLIFLTILLFATLSLHYMLWPFPEWVHVIHRRLCYIPIILAALWFGLRGGTLTAAIVSIAVLPLALNFKGPVVENAELIEITFYWGIGLLTGYLVDRNDRERSKKERLERELADAERLAAVGRAAAGIAHEVRTPLGSIQGATEILEEDFAEDHEHQAFFGILKEETRRLAKVIEDFLDLSRPMRIAPGWVSLGRVVRESIAAVSDSAAGEHVALIVSGDDSNLRIFADADRLRQGLVNLLKNAIQMSPAEGHVEVDLRQGQDGTWIEVRDSGPGISPGEEEQIFEPFFSRRKDGTGLGLALTRQIALAHSGTLTAGNREEGGAVFTLFLPSPESTENSEARGTAGKPEKTVESQ